MNRALKAAAFVALATRFIPVSNGQQKAFEIRGSIVDFNPPFAGIDVWLRAQSTNVERRAVTDESGAFSIVGLAPGQYDLQVGREPITVPSFDLPFLYVRLNATRDLTLILPLSIGVYTQMPCVIHYFHQLLPGRDESVAATRASTIT